jgi:hypothetical protein
MIASTRVNRTMSRTDEVIRLDDEMVELSLLLPGWEVEALAVAATGHGLTTGQMLRTLIREFCDRSPLLRTSCRG